MPGIFHVIRKKILPEKRIREIKTRLSILFGTTDKSRWREAGEIQENWGSRSRIIADWVNPGSSVIEFGAGRMHLKKYLPRDCIYTPADINNIHGNEVLIIDLNARNIADFPTHDIAVFSGVLEYLHDLPNVIKQVGKRCKVIIASYCSCNDRDKQTIKSRRENGWVNDYSGDSLVDIFRKEGFSLIRSASWRDQYIYYFSRAESRN